MTCKKLKLVIKSYLDFIWRLWYLVFDKIKIIFNTEVRYEYN